MVSIVPQGLQKARLGTTAFVLAADKASAFFGSGVLLARCISLTGEGLQECSGPFELSLALPVPPALLFSHQLHHLQAPSSSTHIRAFTLHELCTKPPLLVEGLGGCAGMAGS